MHFLDDLKDFVDRFNFFPHVICLWFDFGSEILGYNLQITYHNFAKEYPFRRNTRLMYNLKHTECQKHSAVSFHSRNEFCAL